MKRFIFAMVIVLAVGLVVGCKSKTHHQQTKQMLYVLFDASKQHFECQQLRESNLKAVSYYVMKKIESGQVSGIKTGVFSRYLSWSAQAQLQTNLPDKVAFKRFKKAASEAILQAYKEESNMYNYAQNGTIKYYAADVYGALQRVIDDIRINRIQKAEIVMASAMYQGVNKEQVKQKLKTDKLVLPSGTVLTAFTNSFVCTDASEYQKNISISKTEDFWRSVIEGSIQFDHNYQ